MEVIDNIAQNRYELKIDGHIAVADYYKEGDNLAITHVEVPHELRGQGVAARLMAALVEDARTKQLVITPICSYAVSYLKRNPV